jgi:propanediol dehydratase small subunit
MIDKSPRYPLFQNAADKIKAASGRPMAEITDEAALSGQLAMADIQISAETLRAQAQVAREAGYGQLAANLTRAAELTTVPNAEVLRMYGLLRPGRATQAELVALADALEGKYQAPECARLVREAAGVYRERGLLKTK